MREDMTKSEAKQALNSFEHTAKVKTLDGEKEYNFVLLKRKDAARVFHNTLLAIAGAFSELIKSGEDTKPEDMLKAIKTLEFDTVWDLGETLLAGVVIDRQEIDLEDYYGENPSELYLAIWYAIQANYPKVFTKLRERLTGSSFAESMTDLIRK
jgi:hypothetical protein